MDQKPAQISTAGQILDIAQRLVQARGFNAFSYADIASALSITKASLHYHFPTKASLGTSLVERYDQRMAEALAVIDRAGGGGLARLRRYADIYAAVLADGLMCLCGMLAAEFTTLPPAMQQALDAYFQRNEEWLAALLSSGRARGELDFAGDPREAAQYFIGSLEGAMMLARPHGGTGRFEAAVRRLLGEFGV